MDELVGLRREGRSEKRVSDEHRTSLTVVLHGGKHQSQVIYSLPLPGPSFFSLLLCVFVNNEQKTGCWPDHCSPHLHCKAIPQLPPCLSPSIQIHYADAGLVLSINLSVSLSHFSSPSFTLFLCLLFFLCLSLFLPLPVC